MSLTTSSDLKPEATSTPTTIDSEDDLELRFLNHCLSTAVQVHYLVTSSFKGEDWATSSLLESDTQQYMKALLSRYTASAALRGRLISGDALYYLQCLTDETTRVDFVRIAAAPLFPFASAQ